MQDCSPEPQVSEPGPKPRAPSRPWTAQEDALLRAAVARYGDDTDQWIAIAAAVAGRTNKSCRKRWKHSLSPTLKKTAWTKEEDELLVKLHSKHPSRWSIIAKQISGRTDDACAKRYREALDPSIKQGEWTEEEDRRLLQEYRRWGGRWSNVAAQLGRSGLGCRNRWRLLERRKNQASSSRTSSSYLPGEKNSISEELLPRSEPVLKSEAEESGETQTYERPDPLRQADLLGELLSQLQTPSQINPLASGSNVPMDLSIPMDPSLASISDNTGRVPYQFDAMLWDIMNGGCGCGCGSKQPETSCAQAVTPAFLGFPPEAFLDPTHQLPQTFPPIGAPEKPHQPHLAPPALPASLSLPSQQVNIPPRPPEDHPHGSACGNSRLHPEPFTPFSTFGDAETSSQPGGGPVQFTTGSGSANVPPLPMQITPASLGPMEPIAAIPPAAPTQPPVKRTVSPRALAIFEDLPRQFQGIDPAKFMAAIALTKVRDGSQTSCRCSGPCRPPTSHPAVTAGSAPTEEASALSCGKKCCCTRTQEVGPSSPGSSLSRRGMKRSYSPPVAELPPPGARNAEPSAKRGKTKPPLVPRLSSHLEAVAGDSGLLPYACGDPDCWRSSEDIRARFNTSGELLDHWRRGHEGENVAERIPDGSVFRCALEGCGKGWKSINGIQYHLQISKAHFALAINKTVLGATATERQGSCSSTGEECQSPSSVDVTEDSVPVVVGSRKKHSCTYPGCPKVYKQAAGLKYHLTHGHPTSGPAQLPSLPPVLYERMLQKSKAAATAP